MGVQIPLPAVIMKKIIISSTKKNELINITEKIKKIISESKIENGVCIVYVPHATAAVTINENADPNVAEDIINAINRIIPEHANYKHDRIDNNAAAHIKASIIGPSQIIPIKDGSLQLGRWQDIFLCEFDGPRERTIIIEIIKE